MKKFAEEWQFVTELCSRVWCVLTWPRVKTCMLNHNYGFQRAQWQSVLQRGRKAPGHQPSYLHKTLQEKPIYFNRTWHNLSFPLIFSSENLMEMLLCSNKDAGHVVTIAMVKPINSSKGQRDSVNNTVGSVKYKKNKDYQGVLEEIKCETTQKYKLSAPCETCSALCCCTQL